MTIYRDVGVVLRTYKLAESDRIVVIHTQRHGKVRAVGKGVRKTNSRFGSRLEPFQHVALQLYQGRDLDVVSQAELVETWRHIRTDVHRLAWAASIAEAVDGVSQERQPNAQLYHMIVGGLRAVEHWNSPLVVAAFYLKLLQAEGVGLIVDRCVVCGETSELVSVSSHRGGSCCARHREGHNISPTGMRIMQLILGGQMNAALTLPVGDATYEVGVLATHLVEMHLERRLRAHTVLEAT